MKKKVVGIGLIVATLAVGAFAVATQYGTQSDPLVTLSYINSVLKPEIINAADKNLKTAQSAIATYEARVDKKVAEITDKMGASVPDAEINKILSGIPTEQKPSAPFDTVVLNAGQSLTIKAGCEVLARGDLNLSGTLIDISTGTEITGKVPANHLCAVVNAATVSASGGTTVYIRGEYMVY